MTSFTKKNALGAVKKGAVSPLAFATPRSSAVVPFHDPVARRPPSYALALAGLLYVLGSLGTGLWYLSLLAKSLANDLWWAGFTSQGGEAILIDFINAQLALSATLALRLDAPEAVLSPRDAASAATSTTAISPTYARRILFTELTSIESVVPQLRQLSASWSMRMNVQHCWVDLNRTLEIAHSEKRQDRCETHYATNAAVYLEAILRNVVYADYITTWGGIDSRFAAAYETALYDTPRGTAFLAAVATARHKTTIWDEVRYWQAYRLTHFKMQWQSRWQSGITETVTLSNAVGMEQRLTLKRLPQGVGPWTTAHLFWMPLNDLRFAHSVNRSLVRGSSRFFGANLSTALPAIDIKVFQGDTLIAGHFEAQAGLFRATIGPFQSVDYLYLGVPPALTHAYVAARSALLAMTSLDYLRLPTPTLALNPIGWRDHAYFGGNLLCTALPRTSYVQQSFDFFDDCSNPEPLTVMWSPLALVLARAATTSIGISNVCAVATPTVAYHAAVAVADATLVASPLAWNTSLDPVSGVEIGLMQYATAPNGSWVVLDQPLLAPSFALFGWLFLFDWVAGTAKWSRSRATQAISP